MKVMKYFAVASLALLAACNNGENPVVPESGNQPVDVVVALNTTRVGTRAAMGDLQGKAEDQAAASLEKVHVYLTDKDGNITVSEEFVKDDANWDKLVNTTPVSATANPGGYKFKDVDNTTKTAVVICNPQGTIATRKNKYCRHCRLCACSANQRGHLCGYQGFDRLKPGTLWSGPTAGQ